VKVSTKVSMKISRLLDTASENSARESLDFSLCEKLRKIVHSYLSEFQKAVISRKALIAFHQSVKMHISKTLKKLDR